MFPASFHSRLGIRFLWWLFFFDAAVKQSMLVTNSIWYLKVYGPNANRDVPFCSSRYMLRSASKMS